MSRVGKLPIPVPKGTKVEIKDGIFVAEGPKGTVTQTLMRECPVTIEDGVVRVARTGNSGGARAKHGLTRALLANAVHGVTTGFSKQLEIVGVGYRGDVKGRDVHFSLGYSHPIVYRIPEGVDVEIDRNNKISIHGADRQQVGQVAAEIRKLRPPDPYKAKGIRYSGEIIRRKVGKAGAR
ncbi:MAG: 50S ribosomal protein L6 [bacterium]|nr:50S ribosomal protein L6 [bacterium]